MYPDFPTIFLTRLIGFAATKLLQQIDYCNSLIMRADLRGLLQLAGFELL